jgi:tight adherence protein C
MSGDLVWMLPLALSLLCMAGGVFLLPLAQRSARVDRRIQAVRSRLVPDEAPERDTSPPWLRVLSMVGALVIRSGLLSRKAINDLEQTMAAAGYRPGAALTIFIGTKFALLVGMPALAWFVLRLSGADIPPIPVLAVGAMVGLLVPDYVVRSIRGRYLKAVEAGLPSALDLLIICAEAGLALEAGFERVADEAREGARATANELRITANEMKILSDRRQALVNMGTRTGLATMARLGSTLAQSLKYGTPLTQALRVLGVEMRHTMLMRFEARAARIPVLLTIPMILFILPCIFVVVAGPAAVKVMHLDTPQ